jgi:hypothetical protein
VTVPRPFTNVARPAPPLRRGAGNLSRARLPLPVLLYLFTVVVPLSLTVGPLVLTTLRLVALVLIVPLAVQLLSGRFGRLLPTDLLFMAFVVWIALALAVESPEAMVQQTGSVGGEFLGGYLIGRAYIRSPEAFHALAQALVLVVCLTFPFALIEAVTGRTLLLEFAMAIPVFDAPAPNPDDMRLNLHRVQATFEHAIHYGLFCSIALPLAIVALKDRLGSARRWTAAILVGASVFLSLSSGALLAGLLQVGFITWAAIFHRIRWRWWLLLGLIALAYVVVDVLSNRTPVQVLMSYATFSPHNAWWRATTAQHVLINVGVSPIFGIGMKDWTRPIWMTTNSVDNFWLLIMLRYGVPGFLLLALGYVVAMVQIMRRRLDGDASLTNIRRAWIFVFLGLSFTLYTVHVWGNIFSLVFFVFGAGMWLVKAPVGEAPSAQAEERQTASALGYTRFPSVQRGRRDAP